MNRRDHHESAIAPRCRLVARPPSTWIGTEAGNRRHGSSQPLSRPIRPPRSRTQGHCVAQVVGAQVGQPGLTGPDDALRKVPLTADHLVDAL